MDEKSKMQNNANFYVDPENVTNLWSFLASIDWSEKWLLTVLFFHLILTVLTITTRNRSTFQAIMFFCLLVLVRSSKFINEYAAIHWKKFSRQQYFDSDGMFISVVISMPVLFNCLIIVLNWLWLSSSILTKLKRAELTNQQKKDDTDKAKTD